MPKPKPQHPLTYDEQVQWRRATQAARDATDPELGDVFLKMQQSAKRLQDLAVKFREKVSASA